jgi:uncharacterized protein (TIGR03437 family)
MVLLAGYGYAQSPSLSLASGSAVKGATLSLNLSLNAATSAPAGLQWTLSYTPADVASLNLVAGPVLTAAGKTLNCSAGVGSVTCLATGINTNAIGSGVVAVVTAALSPTSSSSLDALPLTKVLGTYPDGTLLAVAGTGGAISVTQAALPTVSGLSCSPTALASNAKSTCTVTLSGPAPTGGASVALTNTNPTLSVPASVIVAASATSATFNATTAAISSDQSAKLTATYHGSSATATVSLTASTVVSSLACNPASLRPNSSAICTVTLSKAAPAGGAMVTLSSSKTALTVPASVTVVAASTSATFTANAGAVSSDQSVTLTATYSGSSVNSAVSLVAPALISSLVCTPTSIGPNSSTTCTVTLTKAAPNAGATVSLSDTSSRLSVPASVTVAAAATSANFLAKSGTVITNQSARITATYSGSSANITIALVRRVRSNSVTTSVDGKDLRDQMDTRSQHVLSDLFCTPKVIDAGGQATCELKVIATSLSSDIQITSTSEQIKVPEAIQSRAAQTRLTFQVAVDAAARQQIVTVSANAGETVVQDTIQIVAASRPILTVPHSQTVKRGTSVSIPVTAVDPADMPVQVVASDIPAGATFDPAAGRFEWTPGNDQSGTYKVTFSATNSVGQSASTVMAIDVTSGAPTVETAERACSPGAIATLVGNWLAEPGSTNSDPSGKAMELGGTKVRVNGQYAPVVLASPTQVRFLCPVLNPETQFDVAVETSAGSTEPISMVMQSASPRIFSLDSAGQTQGIVSFAGTTDLAMTRNSRVQAHPAQPGDEIVIWGSGFGSPAEIATRLISVTLGGVNAEVESVNAVPGVAGVYAIQVRVPAAMLFGDAVPVQLQVIGADGKQFNSNKVTIAVETASW